MDRRSGCTITVHSEQNVADIAAPQQQDVGLSFWGETLGQAHSGRVSDRVSVSPKTRVSWGQHDEGSLTLYPGFCVSCCFWFERGLRGRNRAKLAGYWSG